MYSDYPTNFLIHHLAFLISFKTNKSENILTLRETIPTAKNISKLKGFDDSNAETCRVIILDKFNNISPRIMYS
jgi:hypothetical protein